MLRAGSVYSTKLKKPDKARRRIPLEDWKSRTRPACSAPSWKKMSFAPPDSSTPVIPGASATLFAGLVDTWVVRIHAVSVAVPQGYHGNPKANPRVLRFNIAMR